MHYISKRKTNVVEGELRCRELSDYLDKTNSPKIVWLAEDASGMVSKVCYDSSSHQLVGLVLPLNESTRMPIPYTFVPKSANDIVEQMNQKKSNLLYLIMAQPIKEGTPPFILQMYGTNNSFTSEDMFIRWSHTKAELAK